MGACLQGCFGGDTVKAPPLKAILAKKDEEGMKLFINQYCKKANAAKLEQALKLAVQKGSVDVRTPDGSTCLIEAIRSKQEDLVTSLVGAKASLDMKDSQGRSPLQIAQKEATKTIEKSLRKEASRISTQSFMQDLSFLNGVQLFSTLPRSELPRLAAAFITQTFDPCSVVIKQGAPGDDFFVIESGKAVVKMKSPDGLDRVVAVLKEGDYFGEVALLREEPRNATVEASKNSEGEQLVCKVLTRAKFEELDLRKQCYFKKRKAMLAFDATTMSTIEPERLVKTPQESQQIKKALQANTDIGPLLKELADSDVDDIVKSAFRQEVTPGTDVIVQGQLKADTFYVVGKGTFDVIQNGSKVHSYQAGGSFGELALLYRHARKATVKATSEAVLWVINRSDLRKVQATLAQNKIVKLSRLLAGVEIFRHASEESRMKAADALVEATIKKGEYVIKQGDDGDIFYVVYNGEVAVEVNGREVSRMVGNPDKNKAEFFGERALLNDEKRAASIRAVSDKVVLLALDRDTFHDVMPRLPNDPGINGRRRGSLAKSSTYKTHKYDLTQLKDIGLLGCGGFGMVSLVKDKALGRSFALKALSKGHILQEHQEASVKNEKAILRMTDSPFLIRLAATFNGKDHLYFLMEPAMGGEVFTIYHRYNFYGKEAHARFYTACVVRALEHLHLRHIIYRDLKPENLLLDERGYCKVTDFGLAKFVMGHTYTTCGTPDYFAPEMVSGTGYTYAVDWWAVGILIYEFMTAKTPFLADDPMAMINMIKEGIGKAWFPNHRDAWVDLVKQMCAYEPSERLPMHPKGIAVFEQHAWFKEARFDWNVLNGRTMRAPFMPEVASDEDIANFDAQEQDAPPQVSYRDPGTGWDVDFEETVGPVWQD